jgi:hypothetical protein
VSDAPLTPQEITEAALRAKAEGYAHRAAVGIDQFLGSFIEGLKNDQTISSQAEIDAHKKVWYDAFQRALNDGLDLLQKSHGQMAQVGDVVRAKGIIATDEAALSQETGLSAAEVDAAIDKAEGASDSGPAPSSPTASAQKES